MGCRGLVLQGPSLSSKAIHAAASADPRVPCCFLVSLNLNYHNLLFYKFLLESLIQTLPRPYKEVGFGEFGS